ncbi:SDR family NAD(P)-dependent oxidoreductase [Pseudactinotalea sp. Z1739]|uniref:SDR family NAD(P)-dependent oxidoreductase n=1 Tax=Pseudactinotalea sp. Z1739 TaxID=3413028 RepID=UPI003C7D39BD
MTVSGLKGKVALVHGAAGSVGSAVARAFAASGASVHLTGRTAAKVAAVAESIAATGGRARAHGLDVTDSDAVERLTRDVVAVDGRIDVLYNAVTYEEAQGTPLHALDVGALERTLVTLARAHMNTVRCVAPTMIDRGSGVIQTMVGHGPPFPLMGSTAIAWHTVESLYRQFAVELGEFGIRVQWFRTGGFRESILQARDYGSSYTDEAEASEVLTELESGTMLGRLPSVEEAGAFAVFAAGESGASLTSAAINLTAGAFSD